jgi:hypothetical protein
MSGNATYQELVRDCPGRLLEGRGFINIYPTFRKESTKDNLRMPTIRQQTASFGGCECIRDLTPTRQSAVLSLLLD